MRLEEKKKVIDEYFKSVTPEELLQKMTQYEFKSKGPQNAIIINGVCHELVEDHKCSCEVCSLKNQCATEDIYSDFCTYLFQQNKLSHFELRKE